MNEKMITWESIEARPLSYSSLKEFRKSPRHFYYYRQKEWEPPTDSQKLGMLCEFILTHGEHMPKPVSWETKFMEMPPLDLRTNVGKATKLEFIERAVSEHKTLVPVGYPEQATEIVKIALKNPTVKILLENKTRTQRELKWKEKVTWDGVEYRVPMIGYTDMESACHFGDICVEIKTAQSADADNFSRDIGKWLYYLQMATYAIGFHKTLFRFPKFWWLVMETNEPYGANVIEMTQSDIDTAKAEIGGLLAKFVQCMEQNRWDEDYSFWLSDTPTKTYFMPPWLKSPIKTFNDEE